MARTTLRGGPSSFPARLAAFAVLTVVTASACSDGGSPADPTTSSSASTTEPRPTSTTTTEARTVEEEIAARYRGFWQARFGANEEPVDPEDPGLREYATGAQLDNVVEETRRNQREGLAFRAPEGRSERDARVRVLEIDGDEARVQECVVDYGVVYRVDTGEVVDDEVITQSVQATMRRVEGEWKLASTRLLQEWEGVAGCALAEDF